MAEVEDNTTSRDYYFSCPSCANKSVFYQVKESAKDTRGIGFAMFMLGGLLAALLYGSSLSHRVQCGRCGLLFRQPPMPQSAVAKMVLGLFGLLLVVAVVGVLFVSALCEAGDEHGLRLFQDIERLTEKLDASFAGASFLALAAGLVLLVLIVNVSNVRFRRALKRRFEWRPGEYPSNDKGER